MKIYTAARYARREEILGYAKKLEDAGHIVTARWVHGEEEGKSQEAIALLDWEDVIKAEMALVFTDPYGSLHKGGGRHTELGMAYALKKHVWIVGEKEQVFHSLPGIKQFKDIDNVISALSVYKTEPKIYDETVERLSREFDSLVLGPLTKLKEKINS